MALSFELPPLLKHPDTRSKSILVLIATLLVLRSRLLPTRLLQSLEGRHRLSPKESEEAQQQLYYDHPDGSKRLLVPHRGNVKEVGVMMNIATRLTIDTFPPGHYRTNSSIQV